MIVVKLQGGLGNQMFQYAAGRNLLKKGETVYLDQSFLERFNQDAEHFTARSYELGIFRNLKVRNARTWHIRLFKSQAVLYKIIRKLFGPKIEYISQVGNELVSPFPLQRKMHFYMDGYFQSDKYFKLIRENILRDFTFPDADVENERLKRKIASVANSVSVHVRRGDYLRSSIVTAIHGILPLEYYNQAIAILTKEYAPISLFVFSDDMGWVKENLDFEDIDVSFIDINHGPDSWKDMMLMAACKHHIVANSSFSWWGAWLSENKGKVLAPYAWFNPSNVKFDIHDFVPDNWMIINYG